MTGKAPLLYIYIHTIMPWAGQGRAEQVRLLKKKKNKKFSFVPKRGQKTWFFYFFLRNPFLYMMQHKSKGFEILINDIEFLGYFIHAIQNAPGALPPLHSIHHPSHVIHVIHVIHTHTNTPDRNFFSPSENKNAHQVMITDSPFGNHTPPPFVLFLPRPEDYNQHLVC